jgi:hypothetical protein
MENKEYYIHHTMMPKVEQSIKKINKRAIKLGLSPVSIKIVRTEWIKDDKKVPQLFNIITVHGESPKIDGWNFVGSIDRENGVPIIKDVPGSIGIPASYRHTAGICDHCGTARNRKKTYILYNETENVFKEVGSNCLKDFLNSRQPADIVEYISWWSDIDDWIQAFSGSENNEHEKEYIHLETFLAWTCAVAREQGWISAAAARDNETMPSYMVALKYMFKDQNFLKYSKPLDVSDDDFVLANSIITWATKILPQKKNLSTYEYNIIELCKMESVTHRNAGLVASAYISYRKWQEQQEAFKERQKQNSASEFQGKIGEKIERKITVTYVRNIETSYGMSTLISMKDDDGNVYNWFASGVVDDFKIGDVVNIRATVKKHEIYNNNKITYVIRVKIL